MAFLGGVYYFGESQSLVNLSACAAFLTGNTLSADTTFILVGNSIDLGAVSFTSSIISPGFSITFTSDNFSSRFNQNYCKVYQSIQCSLNLVSAGYSSFIRFTKLNMICYETSVFTISLNQTTEYYIDNNCISCPLNNTFRLFANPINDGLIYVYNNKIYSRFNTAGFTSVSVSTPIRFENNTVYSYYGAQIGVGSGTFVINCLLYQVTHNTNQIDNHLNVSATYINWGGLGEFNGNVSGYDFTGVFASTVSSDDNFLDLAGKSVTSAGLIPAVPSNITGIRGNRRPGRDGLYSIGADEYGSDASVVSFESTTYHSPSPAYLRLVDTSDIRDYTDSTDYTRIWKTVNDRTSATTYYQTSASYLDFSVSGVYGDTISISLSAVF